MAATTPHASIGEGQTWFDTHKCSFVDVPVDEKDGGIGTRQFLQAAESTATLFDILGSVAYTPVKNDMLGNVKKIRDRYEKDPAKNSTLQSLVIDEIAGKQHTASEGLLWLNRGLDFTAKALRIDTRAEESQELASSFRQAYEVTLAKHHNFLVKKLFQAAMSVTPNRKPFYEKMIGKGVEEKVLDEAKLRWLKALEERVAILDKFMAGVKWQSGRRSADCFTS